MTRVTRYGLIPEMDKDKGAWCRGCNRRRAWKEIDFEYDMTEKGPRKVLYCQVCKTEVQPPGKDK